MTAAAISLRGLVLALQYFTRIPMPAALARWAAFDGTAQRASLAHFPGAGWLVAGAAMAAYWGIQQFLPRSGLSFWLAAVLSTAVTVLLTGALHEDGLADTADGLGGSRDRDRALDIMKDPRLGSFGTLALVMALLAKTGLLGLIGDTAGWERAAAALLAAHVLSRGLTLVIVATLPNLGRAGQSKTLGVAPGIGWQGLAVAGAWCGLALAVAVQWASPAFCVAGGLVAVAALLWMRRLLSMRLQGFTGDGLGATQQLCEIGFYLGAALALGAG
ncbi:MAG: adenosylcobinamide-GDP ribazoletransferase [Ramlibacter sp.]|nr:adenosylcobinamide-GDP ribazoletransferase [Ramlibacter sp.]